MVDSVSKVIGQIKSSLEGNFRQLSVEGEITNLSLSSTGHWYFTLSDPNASLQAAMFKMDAFRNPGIKKLKDGDKVVCLGSIGVYAKRGSFQIIVKSITVKGKGDLKERFELLKKNLSKEGLFDLENKKKIPLFPKKIAVITAIRGAALQDFLNVYKSRSIWTNIVVIPTLVQGDASAAELVNSLRRTIKYSLDCNEGGFDAIVLTRGGGSLEDLWAFNDEALAWEIHNCPIPVISAVGHEVDYSISDYVSDLRCETPTSAAVVLTEGQVKILDELSNIRKHLENLGKIIIAPYRYRISNSHPQMILNNICDKHNDLKLRLESIGLDKRAPELVKLYEYSLRLDDSFREITVNMEKKYQDLEKKIDLSGSMLKMLNPENVLGRGYSYIKLTGGEVINDYSSFNHLEKGQKVKIHFKDGIGNAIKN